MRVRLSPLLLLVVMLLLPLLLLLMVLLDDAFAVRMQPVKAGCCDTFGRWLALRAIFAMFGRASRHAAKTCDLDLMSLEICAVLRWVAAGLF